MNDETELDDIEGYGALADLLADPSLWEEPPASLEARVMRAVGAEASSHRRRNLGRWVLPFVVGAAAASLAVGLVVVAGRDEGPPAADASVALEVGPAAPAGVGPETVALRMTASGLRLDLAATSLPSLTDGSAYQCWVRTDAGLQTCGTFHTGGSDIVLWSAVRDLDVVQAVAITLEPPGDTDQASSGERVLAGSLTPGS